MFLPGRKRRAMTKAVQMSIKMEASLRDEFMEASRELDRPAAQVIRELMRAFLARRRLPNEETLEALRDVESGKATTCQTAGELFEALGI
jgi:RNA polymerase-binding transcription factor DksA